MIAEMASDVIDDIRNLCIAQIADVINYVRGHFGNHYKDVVSASEVAALPHPSADPP